MSLFYIVTLIGSLLVPIYGQSKSPKIIFKYKKYEKFDFDDLSVSGDSSDPGDLSVGPRFKKRFRNRLPERKNFNKEIYKSLRAIK